MAWQDDLSLRDLDDSQRIEAVCLGCRHTRQMTPVQLMLQPEMHRDARISEAAAVVTCQRPGCRHIGVRLTLLRQDDVSSFVSGMP